MQAYSEPRLYADGTELLLEVAHARDYNSNITEQVGYTYRFVRKKEQSTTHTSPDERGSRTSRWMEFDYHGSDGKTNRETAVAHFGESVVLDLERKVREERTKKEQEKEATKKMVALAEELQNALREATGMQWHVRRKWDNLADLQFFRKRTEGGLEGSWVDHPTISSVDLTDGIEKNVEMVIGQLHI